MRHYLLSNPRPLQIQRLNQSGLLENEGGSAIESEV
jgi:hypothetical protein